MIVQIKDKLTNNLLESYETNLNLYDFLKENVADFHDTETPPISCFVNGEKVDVNEWPSVTDDVVIYPEPKAGAVIGFLVKAVVSYAVNYAITALFGTNDNYNSTTPEGSSIYSVNAQGNSARLNGIIPQLFGTHKYYPDLLSQPFVEYEDDVEYLHMLFSCGVGEYQVDEINIGNTPVDRYLGDIDYEVFGPNEFISGHPAHRNVYTSSEVASFEITSGGYEEGTEEMPVNIEYDFDDDTITAVDQSSNPYNWPYAVDDLIRIYTSFNSGVYRVTNVSTNVITVETEEGDEVLFTTTIAEEAEIIDVTAVTTGDWLGPYLGCPISALATSVYVDLNYPNGMVWIDNQSREREETVDLEIQYREYDPAAGDEDGWTSVFYTRTESTRDELGDTIKIPLISDFVGVPEVRVRRTNEAGNETKVSDAVYWKALRTELLPNVIYDNITTLAVRVRGTNALSSEAQSKFNLVMTRKLPVYNYKTATWSEPEATNQLAPVFSYIIDDSGLGLDKVDLDSLEAVTEEWNGRYDEFNAVFDTDYTLFDSLKKVAAVGFSQPVIDNGQIKAVREGETESYGQFFSYDNTQSIVETGSLFDPDETDGVKVEYFSHDTWKTETIDCLLDGDLGERPEEVRAFGITDETKAWQYGMRLRRAKRYVRKSWTITTELEALNASVGDLITLPNRQTQTGWCEDYTGSVLTLGTTVEFEDGVSHFIGIRKPDGTLSGPYLCTRLTDNQVNIAATLDFTPEFDTAQDPPLFKFGTSEQWRTPAIIQSIEPQADETVIIEATAYDERVYADDNNTPT